MRSRCENEHCEPDNASHGNEPEQGKRHPDHREPDRFHDRASVPKNSARRKDPWEIVGHGGRLTLNSRAGLQSIYGTPYNTAPRAGNHIEFEMAKKRRI